MDQKPNHPTPQYERVKIPFWPTKDQVLGGLGFVIGVNGGPFLVYLGFMFLEWLHPGSTDDKLFFQIFAFLCSVPLGGIAGIALSLAVAAK